jgi:hypothetical protein
MDHAFGYLLLAVKALPSGATCEVDIKHTNNGSRVGSATLVCGRYYGSASRPIQLSAVRCPYCQSGAYVMHRLASPAKLSMQTTCDVSIVSSFD